VLFCCSLVFSTALVPSAANPNFNLTTKLGSAASVASINVTPTTVATPTKMPILPTDIEATYTQHFGSGATAKFTSRHKAAAILGIDANADAATLAKAKRATSRLWHPDKIPKNLTMRQQFMSAQIWLTIQRALYLLGPDGENKTGRPDGGVSVDANNEIEFNAALYAYLSTKMAQFERSRTTPPDSFQQAYGELHRAEQSARAEEAAAAARARADETARAEAEAAARAAAGPPPRRAPSARTAARNANRQADADAEARRRQDDAARQAEEARQRQAQQEEAARQRDAEEAERQQQQDRERARRAAADEARQRAARERAEEEAAHNAREQAEDAARRAEGAAADEAAEAARQEAAMHPTPPPTRDAVASLPLTKIDSFELLDCWVADGVATIGDIPVEFAEQWAAVQSTLYGGLLAAHAAGDEDLMATHLRWIGAAPVIFLRWPRVRKAGTERTRRAIGTALRSRFSQWDDGDIDGLIAPWRHAVDKTNRSTPADASLRSRVLALMRGGNISKAINMAESIGLGDTRLPEIRDQANRKHPARKEPVLAEARDYLNKFGNGDGDAAGGERLNVDVHSVFEGLDRMMAAGCSGTKNEHLTALAPPEPYDSPLAAKAMDHIRDFANLWVNGELPGWVLLPFCINELVMPYKEVPAEGATPDCRPVGCPDPMRRAIESAMMNQASEDFAKEFYPQQVSVGVKGGIELMTHSARLTMETDAGANFDFVKLDLSNAHNEFKRHQSLKAMAERPRLRKYVRGCHSTLVIAPPIHCIGGTLERLSEEGGPQGAPPSSAEFGIAIHDEVVALDTALAAAGGAARFMSDDGLAWGPPGVLWPAVAQFEAAVANKGGILRLSKSARFSPNGDYSCGDANVPVCRVDPEDPTSPDGLAVCNIPLGSDEFIYSYLASKASKTCRAISNIAELLTADNNEAWCAIYYSSQHKLQYWLRGCAPRHMRDHAATVDLAIDAAVERATELHLEGDDITRQRLRLPGRHSGGGVRSMVELAPMAFAGSINGALPRMLDRQRAAGPSVPGFCPGLESALGAGSFDDAAEQPRYRAFLDSGLPTAYALSDAWEEMQEVLGTDYDDDEKTAPLRVPVEAASGTQRDLTTAVEVARRGDFERAIDSLPVDDRRRTAFHANAGCKLSRVWIAGIPDGIYEGAPARHFVEGVASYFGTASPCASPIVGETIFDKDGRNRGYVNKYGDALASLSLIGAGWIRHHDAIKDALCNSMTELGIDASTEVFGLFSPLIPPGPRRAPLDAGGAIARRTRQGLVPDLAMQLAPDLGVDPDAPTRKQLGEVKVIHHCPSRYRANDNAPGVFGKAVARRAGLIPEEYQKSMRKVDTEFGATAAGDMGPCLRQLLAFGAIAAFAFGGAGEASPDLERWISAVASTSASRMRRLIGARTNIQARGCIAWRLRRRVGWAAFNAGASLKIDRCEFVGPGGHEAAQRRAAAARSATGVRQGMWQNAYQVDQEARRRNQRCNSWARRGS